MAPIGKATFRVGEPDWSPERLHFDTLINERAQRAVYSGTSYYRAFTMPAQAYPTRQAPNDKLRRRLQRD